MLRSAAKNFESVAVVVNSHRYQDIIGVESKSLGWCRLIYERPG